MSEGKEKEEAGEVEVCMPVSDFAQRYVSEFFRILLHDLEKRLCEALL